MDLLTFVEMPGFSEEWKDLGLSDDDLHALQIAIMAWPQCGKVIQGTGGLRKLRFAPEKWKVGKSGAVRVCYVYFPTAFVVLLVIAYGKSEKDTLSAAEKRSVRNLISQTEKEFSRRSIQ